MTIVMILSIGTSQTAQPQDCSLVDDAKTQHLLTIGWETQSKIPAANDGSHHLQSPHDSHSETVATNTDQECAGQCIEKDDRLWMISTRHLPTQACRANLDAVDFRTYHLDQCGNRQHDQFETFLSSVSPNRTVVIHVHGNRLTDSEANARGRFVYRYVKTFAADIPMDFVVFSWPAEQRGWILSDGRSKAEITEAESLYFATLLRELVIRNVPVTIVAYSFGCRVASGALHCLAGGSLSGRCLPSEPIVGAGISVGMVAPAVQADWLGCGRHHEMATKNIGTLGILFNSRDAVLKRYWLVECDSRGPALGYAGPTCIAPGPNGSPIPLIKCDCAQFLGLAHNEQEYYTHGCNAGRTMATLIRKVR